jgi:hypothetical protein
MAIIGIANRIEAVSYHRWRRVSRALHRGQNLGRPAERAEKVIRTGIRALVLARAHDDHADRAQRVISLFTADRKCIAWARLHADSFLVPELQRGRDRGRESVQPPTTLPISIIFAPSLAPAVAYRARLTGWKVWGSRP